MGERDLGYDAYYRDQLQCGLEFQDFVALKLYQSGMPVVNYQSKKYQIEHGENITGLEIKHDKKLKDTGNLWIELKETSNPANTNYVESGIERKDNAWLYVIGDYSVLYVFSITMLRGLKAKYKEMENKTKTSIGYLLPRQDAEKYAAKIIYLDK